MTKITFGKIEIVVFLTSVRILEFKSYFIIRKTERLTICEKMISLFSSRWCFLHCLPLFLVLLMAKP